MQGQITANAQAIAELQKLIGDGNFVKNVEASADGIVVTMSNGTTKNVTIKGEAGKAGSIVEIAENGEITIDGKSTGFFATKSAETGKIQMPYVNEEGELITFDAEGKEVKTGIKKNTVVAVKNADGSYTLTIPGADGKPLEIKLPSPASAVSSLTVKALNSESLKLIAVPFTPNADWKGPKASAQPAEGTMIVLGEEYKPDDEVLPDFQLTVNPATVDASEFTYDIVNSKMESVSGLTFTATASKGYLTKAANALYNVNVNLAQLPGGDAYAAWAKKLQGKAFALRANETVVSNFGFTVAPATKTPSDVACGTVSLVDENGVPATATSLELNKVYKFVAAKPEFVFDIYATLDEAGKNLYKATVDNEARTLVITNNPDKDTAGAGFSVTIKTMNIAGAVSDAQSMSIKLSSKLVPSKDYEAVVFNVKEDGEKSYIDLDFDIMRNAMGAENLTIWNKNLQNWKVELFQVGTTKDEIKVASDKFFGGLFTSWKWMKANGSETSASGMDLIRNSKILRMYVNNANAKTHKLELNKQYYIKVTFYNGPVADTNELNSIKLPIEFKAPELASMISVKSSFVVDDVINAVYFTKGEKKFTLSNFFELGKGIAPYIKNLSTKATEAYGNKSEADLFVVADGDEVKNVKSETIGLTLAKSTLTLNAKDANAITNVELGYGKTLTLKVVVPTYYGWSLAAKNYTFSTGICIKNPVLEGTITANPLTITVADLNSGKAAITYETVSGKYADGTAFSIVPDAVTADKESDNWKSLTSVTAKSSDKVILTTGDWVAATAAVAAAGDKPAVPFKYGYLPLVKGQPVQADTQVTVTLTITDDWNYVYTVPVTVNITK